jgi:integrase
MRSDSKYVFITRSGKAVTRLRLNYSFNEAGKKAGIKNKVTPHVLRATWVTLVKQHQDISDSEIMQITGHRSNKMVMAYDKTSDEENVSKRVNFI